MSRSAARARPPAPPARLRRGPKGWRAPASLALAALLAGAGILSPARAADLPPQRHVLRLEQELGDVLPLDVNGDGLLDLVVLEVDYGRRDGATRARVFLQSAEGFAPAGAGDVLPDGVMLAGAGTFAQGPGLALLTAQGVAVWIWRGDHFAPQSVLPVDGLFPRPGGGLQTGIAWVADLNGDGLSELLVPRPDGVTLLRQNDRGEWVSAGILRTRARGELLTMFRRKFAGYDLPVVQVVERAPGTAARAWQTVAVFNDGIFYVFQPDGETVAGDRAPVLQQDMQPPAPFDPKLPYDPPLQLIAVRDLNGDGLPDLVFLKVKPGESEFNARTRILVFFAHPAPPPAGFAFGAEPDQVFDSQGFTLPFIVDLNADGRPDLVLVNVAVGLWTAVKAFIARSVTADVGYYLMSDARQYPRKPDATGTFSVKFSLGRASHQPLALFGDLNGDGLPDLLLSVDKERLGIHWGRPKGFWADDPDETLRGQLPIRSERVRTADLNGDGRDDLILLYGRDDIRQMPETFHTVTVLLSQYGAPRKGAPRERAPLPGSEPDAPPARQRMASAGPVR
jgi:hypothetical protein